MLVAPPGAGKTTRVPLVLIDEPWVKDKKIIVLEPRRLAARAAAERMAKTLGEKVGDTVGLRVRFGSKVSKKTRIEVVTEGIFTRMILDDPELKGIAAVLFDEFHERSLDADLGLAFARDAQQGLREDLKILVMSATLDGARVAKLLGRSRRLIESQGRAFPVETRYLPREARAHIEPQVADAVMRALRAEGGSVLVFLPGQAEIRRTETLLARARHRSSDRHRRALWRTRRAGAGPRHRAVAAGPSQGGAGDLDRRDLAHHRRRARRDRFRARAGAALRAGRRADAARDRAGVARRRRSAPRPRRPHRARRLLSAVERTGNRLARSLCAAGNPVRRSVVASRSIWRNGASAIRRKLAFLDPPPQAAYAEARKLLTELSALDDDGRITDEGRALRALPLPPRLARMVVDAAREGAGEMAAQIAVLVTERGLGGNDVDLRTGSISFAAIVRAARRKRAAWRSGGPTGSRARTKRR